MPNSPEFERNRRRNTFANRFTNSTTYEELGFGLKELIDYALTLEDLARPHYSRVPFESDI